MVRIGVTAGASALRPGESRAQTAAYVAALSQDLSRLARRSGMPTLAYLLDMARLEAEGCAQSGDGQSTEDSSDPGVRLS